MNFFSAKVNCQWSSWGRWSSCSKTCGSGVNARTRRIVKHAKNGGRRCYGSSRATKYCCIRRTCPGMIKSILMQFLRRDGGTSEAARHVPHLILEAYLTIFWEKLHFQREKNSVPHLKKSHSAIPVFTLWAYFENPIW